MASEANVLTISFEIAWEDTETGRSAYNKIYQALNAAIQNGLSGDYWWADNTSYYVVRTTETASSFLARVWNASGMRSSKDRLLVLDANVKTGAAFGHFPDPTVFSLLPFVTKLAAKK